MRIVCELVNPGSRILVVGLSYKPDTDVTEESPGLAFTKQAQEAGFSVDAIDEHVKSNQLSLDLIVRRPSEFENGDYDVAILFVPSASYSTIPGKLSSETKIVVLWGFWSNSVQESYLRLGNYLARN
jgi:UDP-N-acetyl-D-mannosaminuronate dehydrogenase